MLEERGGVQAGCHAMLPDLYLSLAKFHAELRVRCKVGEEVTASDPTTIRVRAFCDLSGEHDHDHEHEPYSTVKAQRLPLDGDPLIRQPPDED